MSDLNSSAPGCFGSVLSHDPSDQWCINCDYFIECGTAANASMEGARRELKIDEPSSALRLTTSIELVKAQGRFRNCALSREESLLIENESLPVKPRAMLKALFRRGMSAQKIVEALGAGRNPFADNVPKVLDVACDLLIRKRTVRKRDLSAAFQGTGMSRRTAYSQCSIVIAALEMLNAVHVDHVGQSVTLRESE